MINIIIHNSGLELINNENSDLTHNAIKNDVSRRKKRAEEILLDLSIHQSAIKPERMPFSGRPDIIHLSLLTFHHNMKLLQEDLNHSINLVVHTKNNIYFEVSDTWRIPVSYTRFRGLIEKLLLEKAIRFNESITVSLKENTLNGLIKSFRPDIVYNLTSKGHFIDSNSFFQNLYTDTKRDQSIVILIGGYQKGTVEIKLKDENVFNLKLFSETTTTWNILGLILHYFLINA